MDLYANYPSFRRFFPFSPQCSPLTRTLTRMLRACALTPPLCCHLAGVTLWSEVSLSNKPNATACATTLPRLRHVTLTHDPLSGTWRFHTTHFPATSWFGCCLALFVVVWLTHSLAAQHRASSLFSDLFKLFRQPYKDHHTVHVRRQLKTPSHAPDGWP